MAVNLLMIAQVRQCARDRRHDASAARDARLQLVGIIDTGSLTDAECLQLAAVYRAELLKASDDQAAVPVLEPPTDA